MGSSRPSSFGTSAAALGADHRRLAAAIINPRVLNPAHPTRRLLARQRLIRARMGLVRPPESTKPAALDPTPEVPLLDLPPEGDGGGEVAIPDGEIVPSEVPLAPEGEVAPVESANRRSSTTGTSLAHASGAARPSTFQDPEASDCKAKAYPTPKRVPLVRFATSTSNLPSSEYYVECRPYDPCPVCSVPRYPPDGFGSVPAIAGPGPDQGPPPPGGSARPAPPPEFWFGQPRASVGVRGSWLFAREGSDFFTFVQDQFTINSGDFNAPGIAVDVGVAINPRADVLFGFEYSGASRNSEYREFVDNNDLPITQESSLLR